MLSAAAARSPGFFWFSSAGALEIIYNRRFTFLNLFSDILDLFGRDYEAVLGLFISSSTSG